jgi:hypothetical protein
MNLFFASPVSDGSPFSCSTACRPVLRGVGRSLPAGASAGMFDQSILDPTRILPSLSNLGGAAANRATVCEAAVVIGTVCSASRRPRGSCCHVVGESPRTLPIADPIGRGYCPCSCSAASSPWTRQSGYASQVMHRHKGGKSASTSQRRKARSWIRHIGV